MRIRQHPTYRHRQLCTIVAIIRNLSKFETIFYRLPWQIAIARARRSRDAPRRVLFGALAIGKPDTPVAPAISLLPPKAARAQYAYAAPLSRPPYGRAQYASHLGAQSACAVRISSHHCPIARAAHSHRFAIASIPKKYRQNIYCVCFDLNALRRIIGMRFAAINATVMMRITIDESALIDGLMRFDIV